MFIEKIEKEELLKPLQIVVSIVDRKMTLPIMSNVLIENHDGCIRLITTDSEIQITTFINIETNNIQNDAFTVNGKKFLDILKVLPEHCKISIDINEYRVQIRTNKSRFSLQTLPSQDFPKLIDQTEKNSTKISMPQKDLKNLLFSIQYAMAQQDVRYYLNGVLFIVIDNKLKAVATDGHRLAFNVINIDGFFDKQETIIPRKAVLELYKLLTDSDEPVELEFSQQQFNASFSDIIMKTKVIEGKFPDYERVIPRYNNHLIIERNLILQALQRAAILSNEKFRGVRFVLTEKNLSIISNNSEQEEAQEEIDTDYHGEALDIGFNVNYIMDGLNNLNGSTVVFSFGDSNSSILVTTQNNLDFRYVVMPMRI